MASEILDYSSNLDNLKYCEYTYWGDFIEGYKYNLSRCKITSYSTIYSISVFILNRFICYKHHISFSVSSIYCSRQNYQLGKSSRCPCRCGPEPHVLFCNLSNFKFKCYSWFYNHIIHSHILCYILCYLFYVVCLQVIIALTN